MKKKRAYHDHGWTVSAVYQRIVTDKLSPRYARAKSGIH